MSIYKPSNLKPQNSEVDLTQENTFSCQVNTNGEPIQAHKFTIYSKDGTEEIFDSDIYGGVVNNKKTLNIGYEYEHRDGEKIIDNDVINNWVAPAKTKYYEDYSDMENEQDYEVLEEDTEYRVLRYWDVQESGEFHRRIAPIITDMRKFMIYRDVVYLEDSDEEHPDGGIYIKQTQGHWYLDFSSLDQNLKNCCFPVSVSYTDSNVTTKGNSPLTFKSNYINGVDPEYNTWFPSGFSGNNVVDHKIKITLHYTPMTRGKDYKESGSNKLGIDKLNYIIGNRVFAIYYENAIYYRTLTVGQYEIADIEYNKVIDVRLIWCDAFDVNGDCMIDMKDVLEIRQKPDIQDNNNFLKQYYRYYIK